MDWLVATDDTTRHTVLYYLAAGVCAVVAFRTLRGYLYKSQDKTLKDGVIYLHIFPRHYTKKMVNLSPYGIKVETWLRMNHVHYEAVETTTFSRGTKQIPYIVVDGEEHTDSNLIIDWLTKRLRLDGTEGLSTRERAISRAFTKMLDENTAWTYFLFRYVFETKTFAKYYRIGKPWPIYRLVPWIMKHGVRNGLRRKPPEVIAQIGNEDIRAVSEFLGDRTFMFGDKPTKVDCTVFGHLSQVLFPDMPYPQKDFIKAECHNLVRYMENMRTTYWPDWDSLVTQGTFE